MTEKKKPSAWQRLVKSLPVSSRKSLVVTGSTYQDSPDNSSYDFLCRMLPPSVQSAVAECASSESDADEAHAPTARWCVCEQPEGDFPRVRVFGSAEGMARYLGSLEGKEISVWAFNGIPLRFTKSISQGNKSPRRYLYLPGEVEAVSLPRTQHEPLLRVPVESLTDADWQDDGWIGPAYMTDPVPEDYYKSHESKLSKKSELDDDIDDEDGELDPS